MKRIWSIRARTALAFAIAAMALAGGVVVFTNLMSISGAGKAVSSFDPGPRGTAVVLRPDPRGGALTGVERPTGAESADLAVVQIVAIQQWQWSAVGIAGAGLVAGAMGWLLSRRMLRPIDRMTATAMRITASNLHERIALDGPDDELRRLSRTFDDLLDRLETAFESQRRFVAQASHELRTPLAVQRAALQIGLPDEATPGDVRATRDELLEQNRRTEHIVESLLVMAEADRGLAGSGLPVDIAALAAEVVATATGPARDGGVTVTHQVEADGSGWSAEGDPTLVRQMLVNLVSNAVEYNQPGGFVRVVLGSDGLVVENSGPVVPDEAVPRLTEPFRRCAVRASERTRHSGLGLSIVASVVQAHGWRLSLSARRTGGLRVHVSVV